MTEGGNVVSYTKVKACIALVLFCSLFVQGDSVQQTTVATQADEPTIAKTPRKKLPGDHLWDLVKDAAKLNLNLFHPDSFKILASAFPVIVAGYMADNSIHKQYYCFKHHKNCRQMHHYCHNFAEHWAIPLTATTAAGCFVFAHDENLRQTSRMFILGLPFVIWMSDLLKAFIKVDTCYRPFNERFYRHRSVTGFPSTHAAQATYAAVLFGMRCGPAWGVPLGLLDLFIGFSCLNDNRHFFSQYLGGMTLGALYAFAADKVVSDRLKELDVAMTIDNGRPGVKVGFRF